MLLLLFCFIFLLLSFLQAGGAVKWSIVKEQPVCVWNISCWFSGTLAWWMARQKTPNNRWFACRENFSLRPNGVQPFQLFILLSNPEYIDKSLRSSIGINHLLLLSPSMRNVGFFKNTAWNLWGCSISRLLTSRIQTFRAFTTL